MPLLTTSKPIWETVTYPLGPGGLGWKTVRLEVWNGRSWSFLATATRHGDGAAICEAAHVASSIARPFDTVRALWWTGSKWYQDNPPMTLGALLKACSDAGYYDVPRAQAVSGGPHVGDAPATPIGLPPPGWVVTTEKGLAYFLSTSTPAACSQVLINGFCVPAPIALVVNALLADPAQRGAFDKFVRVVRPDGYLVGHWVWSNNAWCHHGGPWDANVPGCTGVYPPLPTYPAYSRNLAWRGF